MREVDRPAGFSSGELARLTGLSSDTLRHYERKGVLGRARRLENGYRRYGPESVDRVRLVRAALSLGFTLDELGQIFAIRRAGGAPCKKVRALAAEKLAEAEVRLRELEALVESLRALVAAWDARLADTPHGTPARLLESLEAAQGRAPKSKRIRGENR